MKFNSVFIESFAHHLPDKVITSDELEARLAPLYERIKLPAGRLELMTGIRERRMWDVGTRPSELSAQAAKKTLDKSNISKDQIEILIHASVCRDFLEPATASVVHHHLGLSPKCMIMDVSNACLGVLSSFLLVANMIESGAIKCGMVVSGENSAPLLEETINFFLNDTSITRKSIKKYFANLTIGSAAVGYILTHKDLAPNGHKILGGASMTKSDANKLCQGDGSRDSLMMETESEELLHAGIELATSTWDETKKILNWNNDTPDWIITHQVGKAHEAITFDKLNISLDKAFANYQTLGNTGSAALPSALSQLSESGKIKKGDLVALLGIGSGLSSTMLGVQW